jgi:hypothetical protein
MNAVNSGRYGAPADGQDARQDRGDGATAAMVETGVSSAKNGAGPGSPRFPSIRSRYPRFCLLPILQPQRVGARYRRCWRAPRSSYLRARAVIIIRQRAAHAIEGLGMGRRHGADRKRGNEREF